MKLSGIIYITAMAMLMASCSKQVQDVEGAPIQLSAAVTDIQASTKASAEPFRGTTPTNDYNLNAKILFSTTPGTYTNTTTDATTKIPCHTAIKYTSGSLTYPVDDVRYPTAGGYADVYCTGLYPITIDGNGGIKDNWKISDDGKTASHPITGTEDIMYAPEISGKWDVPFGSSADKIQHYSHLLTWLKICVCATSSSAAEAWSEITKIEVLSKKDVNINLGTKAVLFPGETTYLPAYELTEGYKLATTTKELGSVMCSPETSYSIKITLKDGSTVSTNVPLKNLAGTAVTANEAAGKLYVLSLYFTEYKVIEGACTLTAWNDQYEDLYGTTTTN